jgi:hypothetical protein
MPYLCFCIYGITALFTGKAGEKCTEALYSVYIGLTVLYFSRQVPCHEKTGWDSIDKPPLTPPLEIGCDSIDKPPLAILLLFQKEGNGRQMAFFLFSC